jgi:hypothetical protein
VGIGFGTIDMPQGRCPGHLVLRAGQHYLLDAPINQASRPAISNSPDGSIIRYEPDPADNGYLASPAWSLRPGIEEAACREILARLYNDGGLPRSRSTCAAHRPQSAHRRY